MVRTNLQEFVGDVHVLSNLQVGSNLFANDLAANVLTVDGSIGSTFFIGDGGLLSNIATTLNDIVANPGGNTVSNTLVFESGADATSNTAIATLSNVGISISNTEPTGEFQFAVGSNIFVNTHASNVLTVVGAIGSDLFIGDGGLLSNIATTLDQIVDQGNTVSNTLIFESGIDATSNAGIVTKKDVGISVSNTEPTGEFQFGVGSNLLVNVYSSNVLAIEGNVSAEKMTLGTITVTSAYGLNHVTAQGSVTGDTISLTNATTGLEVTSNLTAGGNVTAETVITSANVEVGDRLKFASNVFVDDLRVADVAANLVTYDKTTGELMDSGGLFANKLAVVSVQPPSALSANTTTIAKHGTYTVTTSGLESTSNAWNAFDGDSAVEWKSIFVNGRLYDADGIYTGSTRLATTTKEGEWLAIEFPYKTTLRHMKLTPPATTNQYPASANVYATNDSLTWTEVVNWSDVNPVTSSNVQTIIVNATESFKKYAMVVTKANEGNDNVALAKWDLFTESFSIDGGKVEMATSAVMGGETTVDQHGPHSRDPKAVPLKKYPEIIFDASKMDGSRTSTALTYDEQYYLQAGTTIKVVNETTSRVAHQAFNGDIVGANGNGWHTQFGFDRNTGLYDTSNDRGDTFTDTNSGTHLGMWIQTKFPNKIKVKNINLYIGNSLYRYPKSLVVLGHSSLSSLTGWTLLHTETDISTTTPAVGDTTPTVLNVNANTAFDCYTILVKSARPEGVAGQQSIWFSEIEYYGYEEDPPLGDTSVDTTFTSIMNTPQTTGANIYTDAKLSSVFTNHVTGPTPVGTAAVHDNTNKYWEMNGQLTSNIAVEANTFLEGDAPHSVSVWFNSSNLEANVSNTCVFSVSDQEKLDSVNLDLQSNTWHNLTYAYQGEGGSRVTYLDGRKVAEDQAEDTFGEYPPFAMTGYSQGGYVVSASGEYPGTSYLAHEAFNGTVVDNGDCWLSTDSTYDATTGNYNGNANLGSDSGGPAFANADKGEWLKLEMPHKFVLDYITICGSTSTAVNPKDWKIYGSNDDKNWDVLLSKTNAVTVAYNATSGKEHNVGATKAYKYFALVVIKSGGLTSGTHYIQVSELEYYGHRENDLVRLPDPTNVLKYPHIAMTGPAQRGYVAEQTNFSGFHTDGYSYRLFDDSDGQYQTASVYSSGVAGGSTPTTTATDSTAHQGVHITLTLPHKIQLQSVKFKSHTYYARTPASGTFLGSNNNSTWDVIGTFSGIETTSAGQIHTVNIANYASKSYYKYIRLVVTHTSYSVNSSATGGGGLLEFRRLEYYGTGVDSIPIQIGGGNIDKVANFRVYDKFVGEDQALEIWDAQKDEFERAKSSMTLHKGRLGIGTTEPEGRLAVVDEPHNLEEFPPRAMTGYKTYFEGHGEFCVRVSSADNGLGIQNLFDKLGFSGKDDSKYLEWGVSQYTSSTGVYTGSVSTQGVSGEWLEIEMPYKIKLGYNLLYHRSRDGSLDDDYWVLERMPRDGAILGSNDGETWTTLQSWTDFDWVTGTSAAGQRQSEYWRNPGKLVTNSTAYYKTFRLIFSKLFGANGDRVNIGEWRLFGTREQGQSVLHDGQLTLTKSLTVPRIGPALDADDTPRRDRLVVEYNTSTNPTFEGAVRDTSGRGNDGVFYGGASYDATEKALVFDGTDDYIFTGNLQNSGGDIDFTISMWVKPDTLTSSTQSPFLLGKEVTDEAIGLNFTATNVDFFVVGGAAYNYTAGGIFDTGSWKHFILYRRGGLMGVYVNGVYITPSVTGSGSLDLPQTTQITLGNRDDQNYFNGSISNFKLWDTALTAEEVKTLYDMGRCDEGHHVVNFSKTRVGIGLGDGETPRGALDVRGDIYGGCPVFFHATRTSHAESTSSTGFNPLIWQSTRNNKGGGYSTTTGKFTAPIAGYYEFIYGGMSVNIGDTFELLPRLNNVDYVGPIIYSSADSSQQHRYGTATAIVEMQVGDTWHLRIPAGANGMYGVGNAYNMFTGKFLSY